MRMMVLIRIWVDGAHWTGQPAFIWGEERAVSESDTLSADNGWGIQESDPQTYDVELVA